MRRRQSPESSSITPAGLPADLALGPRIEVWADPDSSCPQFSARTNWRDARNEWAADNGLTLPADYRHLPRELCDRAPYYREAKK